MNLLTYRILTGLALPFIAYAAWKRCQKHKKTWHNKTQQLESLTESSLANHHTLPLEIPFCFRSRFGFNPTPMQKGGIWIHAVSVGETRSVFGFLKGLKTRYPDLPVTLTNSSFQGAIHAHEFCPIAFQHQMLPLDYPFAVNRFLSQIQPKLVIMVETEIWPNLYHACQQQNIPVVLINARLKDRSLAAYKKWGGTAIQNALNQTAFIGAQSQMDADNFAKLGVLSEKVKILGNLKSDIQISDNLMNQVAAWQTENKAHNRMIWVAASTHANPENGESEESLILKAHQQLLKTQPDALLILVPRHAARFDEVATFIEQSGLSWQKRSHQAAIKEQTQVYLADSLGEMMLWYALADIAFIGGSLVPFGGHNILEPASVKTPVISGPHFHNLTSMFTPFIEEKAISIVNSSNELAEHLNNLFTKKEKAAQQSETAFNIMQNQTGALDATLQEISKLLD